MHDFDTGITIYIRTRSHRGNAPYDCDTARGPVSKDRCWAAVFVRFTGDFRRHCTGIYFVLHIWARFYIKMSKHAVDKQTDKLYGT
jgi:hypothetical protein